MIGYQFEFMVRNHSKGEIYDFCRRFGLSGSVTRNKVGNIIIEVAGEDEKLGICAEAILDYMKEETLIMKSMIEELSFKGTTLLIG